VGTAEEAADFTVAVEAVASTVVVVADFMGVVEAVTTQGPAVGVPAAGVATAEIGAGPVDARTGITGRAGMAATGAVDTDAADTVPDATALAG
jgi:hypothetical protein